MTSTIELTADDGSTFAAYIAEPEGEPKGAVIVIHEIWGLVGHIRDVADRFADEGYFAIAPDLLTNVGIDAHLGLELQDIMFNSDAQVRSDGQPRLREALAPLHSPAFGLWALGSLRSVVDHLSGRPGLDGRIAVAGFCFGGSYSFMLAAGDSRISAAVPFYGQRPSAEAIAEIGCPVLAFYGENDEALITALPSLRTDMTTAGVDFTPVVYPGIGHAFFNDTNPITYDEDAADDAWSRTISFIDRALGAQR